MSLRVLKWSVPVDDQVHEIGAGRVLHVECQNSSLIVEVWTLEADAAADSIGNPERIPVRAHGTGQPLPGDVEEHLGSALADPFVWHLFRVHTTPRGHG